MMSRGVESELLEWKPINNRITKAQFYSKFIKLTIILLYTPTLATKGKDKNIFYEELQSVIENVAKPDLQLVMGEVKAKDGSKLESGGNLPAN